MTTSTAREDIVEAVTQAHATGALAIRPDQTQFDTFQLAALRQMGVEEAPNGDLAVFLHYSQRTGLDPFARQIYMIPRKSRGEVKWTIQAGIDALRIVAQRSGEYAGQVGPEWCDSDGQWHDVWLHDHHPAAARVGVLRQGFAQPLYAVAHWGEYAATYDGKPTGLWGTKPAVMIAKCAEALALRKAFPMDLSGIHIAEERAHEDAPDPTAPAQEAVRHDTADAETVARLRRNVLGATDVEGTRDLLQATWDESLAVHARDCEVQVPQAWQELAKAERVTLGALIVGAAQAHAQGIPHGEDLTEPDPDGAVDADVVDDGTQPEPCTNRSGGRYCTREQGHDGRHTYPKADAPATGDACGAEVGGWTCSLPAGHDGDHQV